MVDLYAKAKGDDAVYKKYLPALEKEYAFWMNRSGSGQSDEHTVKMGEGMLNRYYDKGQTPRQESHREDKETADHSPSQNKKKVYRDLRSGAESGWDYSSRWFSDGESITSIVTTDIIPIDLNALLYGLEGILLTHGSEEKKKSQLTQSMATREKFMREECWVASRGVLEDYNWVSSKTTGRHSLAMSYPLYFKMVSQEQADGVASYLREHFLQPGGLSSTLAHTGQQWDAPNGWAPLQWMSLVGLENYGHGDLARDIAQRWVTVNERVYKNTGKFVEKYNVEDMSLEAGGGEYPVQDGFGWSNGVYLAMKSYLNGTWKYIPERFK